MSQGLLISFDGTDSSGKATQASELTKRLQTLGHTVKKFETPDYATESGQHLKKLFQGKAGSWDDLAWQEQMKLLANNRAEHRQEVIDTLNAGGIVVYDRYVPSSVAHMAVDALGAEEIETKRHEIARQVEEYEYNTNSMPRESLSIFLDVPPRISNQLLESRKVEQGDEDETTDDVELQKRIYGEYLWLTSTNPAHFIRIDCVENEELLDPATVSERIWETVTSRFEYITKKL